MFRMDEEDESKAGNPAPAIVEKALFDSRTILLTGGVDDKLAQRVCERLLALSGDSDQPILLIISSPGGHVESGDMIHDMIKFVSAPVNVLGSGWVASAGALIYAAAERERRFCLPNTRFLLHDMAKMVTVTSSLQGEGKSFIATNFAKSLAAAGVARQLFSLTSARRA